MRIAFGNRLSAQSWAAAAEMLEREIGQTPRLVAGDPQLEIDLSEVSFADFTILGRLLILIDSFASRGTEVVVRMPNADPLDRELPYLNSVPASHKSSDKITLERIGRHRRQRSHCRLFMKQSGFESAIQRGPWPTNRVRIVEASPRLIEPSESNSGTSHPHQFQAYQAPRRARRILPYRWLPPISASVEDTSSEIRAVELELEALGLPPADCAVLARGVIAELIENIREHAAPPRSSNAPSPLLGATFMTPENYSPRIDDFDTHIHDFLRWASDIPSPMVSLLVGDSGAGLLSQVDTMRLGSYETPEAAYYPGANDAHRSILYAFDRWTSSRPNQFPTRGLWKVLRIVRSYGGVLLVNSGDVAAGYVFGQSLTGKPVINETPCWTSGTLVECDILTVPGRWKASQDDELPSPVPAVSAETDTHLVCTIATLRPGEGIDSEDLRKIQDLLEQLHRPTDGLVIAVNLPAGLNTPNDNELRESIQHIFRLASEAANPATVSLVFAGANRKLLTLAVTDFNNRSDTQSVSQEIGLDSPILVVAPENLHYWAGGTPAIRNILSRLSQTRGPLRLHEFDDVLGTHQAQRQMRDQAGLVSLKDDMLSLNLRPQDVILALADHFGRQIEEAIRLGNANGVKTGVFLTSNLRFTSRWTNVQELLTTLRCERLAGLVLASMVGARVGFFMHTKPRTAIVRIGAVPDDLMSVFAISLTGVDRYYDGVASLPFSDVFEDYPRDVVLCTEQISTGHSIARAARELEAHGVAIVAVAAIIDARDTQPHIKDDQIEGGRNLIPLVKLAEVEIGTTEDVTKPEDSTAIDPVTGTPLPERRLYAITSADQFAYIDAIIQTRAARLGHITRPARRHYTAYVDQTLLFRDKGWARRASHQIVRRVREGMRGEGAGAPVMIVFPSGTNNYLEEVSLGISAALSHDGIPVVGVSKAPRAVLGTDWVFPPSIELPHEDIHVLILDSGIGNGHGLLQFIRLVAAGNVKGITAVVLADGLNEPDAMCLQQIRSVATPESLSNRADARGREIPVRINFLSRTAVSRFDAAECPVCSLRSSYSILPRPASELLAAHQRLILRALEPHTKETAFSVVAEDLFGTPIASSDCVLYLRWRSRLRDAIFSTKARGSVVKSLNALAQGVKSPSATADRDAFIRLIVAESQWLERAPLFFSEVRITIADACRQVLSSGPLSASDALLRMQAIIALASAAPQRLVDEFEQIVFECLDHSFVISQVLMEAYRLIGSELTAQAVLESLAEALERLEGSSPLTASKGSPGSGIDISSDIRYLISLMRRRLKAAPDNPQSAWALLLGWHRTSVRDHKYDQAIWRLRVHLDDLLLGLPPQDPDLAIDDWLRCSDSLATEVLPNLQPLARILLSKRVVDSLPRRDEDPWAKVVRGGWPELLDDITVRLRKVFMESSNVLNKRGDVGDLLDDVEWWNRFFFSAPSQGDRPRRDAFLVEILQRCPANVYDVVEHAFVGVDYEIQFKDIPDDTSMRVFCTTSLLSDVFSHIRLNAEIKHRLWGLEQAFMITLSKGEGNILRIAIYNSASEDDGNGEGRGLAVHASELARFGAGLTVCDVLSPWTYGVVLTLERWRMMR